MRSLAVAMMMPPEADSNIKTLYSGPGRFSRTKKPSPMRADSTNALQMVMTKNTPNPST